MRIFWPAVKNESRSLALSTLGEINMEQEEKNGSQNEGKGLQTVEKIGEIVQNEFNGWSRALSLRKDPGIFLCFVKTPDPFAGFFYLVHVRSDSVLIFINTPILPSDVMKRREAAAELVARLNHSIRYGRFEMDYNDGQIRYALCVDCVGALPTEDRVHWAFVTAAVTATSRFKTIRSVVKDDVTPRHAVKELERSLPETLELFNEQFVPDFGNWSTCDDE